ncbi:hypothetical protein KUTeg_021937 [Tegillarca granosa]|uniref:Uncharacterized protein n=1 Tax=Tegillarca granosa TaxID=220873 RepID=A0ABQ9EAY7_TEGGR|nr:hypothetical protein KUTeg_021937 [Tegillarca granosa]
MFLLAERLCNSEYRVHIGTNANNEYIDTYIYSYPFFCLIYIRHLNIYMSHFGICNYQKVTYILYFYQIHKKKIKKKKEKKRKRKKSLGVSFVLFLFIDVRNLFVFLNDISDELFPFSLTLKIFCYSCPETEYKVRPVQRVYKMRFSFCFLYNFPFSILYYFNLKTTKKWKHLCISTAHSG